MELYYLKLAHNYTLQYWNRMQVIEGILMIQNSFFMQTKNEKFF